MSVSFYKVDSVEPVARISAKAIGSRLASDRKVLWLVAGGSSVDVAVTAAKQLVDNGAPLNKLVVSLTDERYGEPGHKDSNWQRLLGSGFELPGAELRPVLDGKPMEEATADFDKFLEKELGAADYRIGLFGIGADGHTSGILPNSAAVKAKQMACGYDGGEFQRVTTTPAAIARLDEAVVYAVGAAKRPVIESLETDIPVDDQPAQVLKKVKKLTVFNDYKG